MEGDPQEPGHAAADGGHWQGECKPALHRYKGFVDYLTVEDKEPQLLIPRGLHTEVIHLAHKRYQRPDRTVGLLCQTCLFYDIGNRIK